MNGPFNIEIPEIVNFQNERRQTRTGVTTSVVEEFVESRSDRQVSTNIAQTMRARDITVSGENFKPNTRYYVFFDGIDVNSHMTPTSSTYGIGGGTSKGTGLRSDNLGEISATFSIPSDGTLNFSTGQKSLKITDSSTNTPNTGSQGEAIYAASGEIRVMQEEILSTRNGRVITDDVEDSRIDNRRPAARQPVRWVDPLAQSFLVDQEGGIFVSSVEVYFGAKDTALPVTAQIRHMENGMPTQKIIPFGDKSLSPASVNVSNDGSSATKFTFDSPVYLESGREYCVVIMTNSNVYTCWVSEMGQKDIKTNDFIDRQPYAGVMFKSQNNSTWTADQLKDLKLKINRCKFTTGTSASVVFENSGLEVEKLANNPIETISGTKTFRVWHYSHGNYDENLSNITIADVKGDRTNSVFSFSDDTITGLSGLTADAQTLAQTSTSGSGTGLTATITTTTTATTSIVITNPGQGYAVSDTVVFTKDSVAITFTVAAVRDTLGGIPIEYINEPHVAGTSASGSTSGAKILSDIDSYLITIPSDVWPLRVDGTATTSNIQTASESTLGGGSVVTATANAYFDALHTAIPSIELPNTSITSTFMATSATQATYLASPATSYTKDSSSTTITLNDNNYLASPKIVASNVNQTNEMGGKKSLSITCQLNTTKDNVSPVLDVDSIGMVAIQNRINKSDSSSDMVASNYVSSTEARGDSSAAVYMTKRVQLKEVANAIHVIFDALKRPDVSGTDPSIEVYYKVMGNDSNTQFRDLGWVEATIKESVQPDASDFKEHLYEIESLEDFSVFAIKIVLQSVNSSNVPLLENFRAIALST